jgi:hypothetical protein
LRNLPDKGGNMKCPTDSLLRACIDDELAVVEAETINLHVQACTTCQTRSFEIRECAERVRESLNELVPQQSEIAMDPSAAYVRYRQEHGDRPYDTKGFHRLWRRPLWGACAAICALVLLFSLAPGRSWAQKILQMLRVQKIAVVPVNLSAITADIGSSRRGDLISQLISDDVVVTMNPGEPQLASSPEAASGMAGFTVKTLAELGTPQRIYVTNQGAFHMTLDRDRIQAVLDQAGRSDIQVPEAIDGSTVAVHIPRLANVLYGNCPQNDKPPSVPVPQRPSPANTAADCVHFVQVPSPTVSVPPSFNIAGLAEAALQVAGLSAAEAHAFSQTVDWSSTLVIPVPQNGSSYRTVSVDGVNGTLVEAPAHGNFIGRYDLIWVKKGIVYSLGGHGSADRVLSIAESLN